jgi:hypothetical protein
VDPQKKRTRRREAAERYKPDSVDILLVAEAPPGAPDRYFYFEDVQTQDSLFRYVARSVLDEEPTRENKRELLAKLRDRGVFLIDLKEDPLDGSPLAASVESLVARCRSLDPRAIILIKATVYDESYGTLKRARLPVVDERIPFPGSGQQRNFENAFAKALESARGLTRAGEV